MDRREAIINLEAIKDFYGADWKDGYTREFVVLDKEEKEAIDMAIAALQEPGIVRKEGEKKQVTGNQKSVETSTDKAEESTVNQPKSKLKNPCDSLLKPDSDECKEQKSKLDCISRQQAVEAVSDIYVRDVAQLHTRRDCVDLLESLPPVNQKQITGKLENAENATSEGDKSTTGQPKSKLDEKLQSSQETSTIPEVIESHSDLISRQAAIETIEEVDWYHVNPKGELVSGSLSDEESWYRAEDVFKAIESLPPVTPTERTGEWKKEVNENLGKCLRVVYVCSACGCAVGCEYFVRRSYCPNCGAKMNEGGDDNG